MQITFWFNAYWKIKQFSFLFTFVEGFQGREDIWFLIIFSNTAGTAPEVSFMSNASWEPQNLRNMSLDVNQPFIPLYYLDSGVYEGKALDTSVSWLYILHVT